ncbi:MAG: hypothetical protein ABI743_06400, partial [bacterium]
MTAHTDPTPTLASTGDSPGSPPGTRRRFGCGLLALALFTLFLLVLVLVVTFAPAPFFRTALSTVLPYLEDQGQITITHDGAHLQAVGSRLILHDVHISDRDSNTPIASIGRLELIFKLQNLYRRNTTSDRVEFLDSLRKVRASDVEFWAARTSNGFDFLSHLHQKPGGATSPVTARVQIERGTLHYTDYPLTSDSRNRDWKHPKRIDVGFSGELNLQRNAVNVTRASLTPPGSPSTPLMSITGGWEADQGWSATSTFAVYSELLQPGGLLAPLVPTLHPQAATVLSYVTDGILSGTLITLANMRPNDKGGLTLEAPRVSGDVTIKQLQLTMPGVAGPPWVGDAALAIHPNRIRLTRLLLDQGPMHFQAIGAVDRTGTPMRIDLQFLARDLDLALLPFRLPLDEKLHFAGPVTGQGTLRGTLENPELRTVITSPRLRIGGDPYVLGDSPVRYANGVLAIDLNLQQGARRAHIVGESEFAANRHVYHFEAAQLPSSLIPQLLPSFSGVALDGALDGTVLYVSDPQAGPRADIALSSHDGRLSEVPYRSLLAKLSFANNTLTMQQVIGTLPYTTQGTFQGQGVVHPGGRVELHLQAGGIELADLAPGREIKGQLLGSLDLSGTMADLSGTYALEIFDGEFPGLPFSRFTQKGTLTETSLKLDECSLILPSGSLSMEGSIDLTRSPQVALTGAALQSYFTQVTRGGVVRRLAGNYTLRSDLNDLTFQMLLQGEGDAGATRFRLDPHDDPWEIKLSHGGLDFVPLPHSWSQLLGRLRRGGLPSWTAPMRLQSHGAILAVPIRDDTGVWDPYFAASLRKAAPTLAQVMLQSQGVVGPGPALRGVISQTTDWLWNGSDWIGDTTIEAPELLSGGVTITDTTLRLHRSEVATPLQLEITSQQAAGQTLALTGTVTPRLPLDETTLDLRLALDHYPAQPLVALISPQLVASFGGQLDGGGQLTGSLAQLTTPPTAQPENHHLYFTVTAGRAGDLAPLEGAIDLGFAGGLLTIHQLDLSGPNGATLRGAGTIYTTREQFTDSRATLYLAALPLEKLQPLLGPTGPKINGTVEQFNLDFAFASGVPVVRGQFEIDKPGVGTAHADHAHVALTYNPFTRQLLIEETRPAVLTIGESEAKLYGTASFPKDELPELALRIETAGVPISTVLPAGGAFSATGGLGESFVWIERAPRALRKPDDDAVHFGGDIGINLGSLRFLGEQVADTVEGTVQLQDSRLQFWHHQFAVTSSGATNVPTKVYLEGFVDLASLGKPGGSGGQSVGHFQLEPEVPGAVFPLHAFGVTSGLFFDQAGTEGSRPLTVSLQSDHLTISGTLKVAPGSLDLS